MADNSKLFSFIFLTVKASANDSKSKNFLPTILSSIQHDGKPLLPLKEDSWSVGKLLGTSGLFVAKNIADKYYIARSYPVIPYPKNPDPLLELKDSSGTKKIEIEGLENVYITGFNNYKYDDTTNTVTADIDMQFNYWTKNSGGLQPDQKITPLVLNTPFILTQELCKVAKLGDKKCLDSNASPISVVGDGIFTAKITEMNFVASVKIGVKPNRAGLDASITKLTLITTGDNAPKFTDVKPNLNQSGGFKVIIGNMITLFMEKPEASNAVFTQMQSSLNTPNNINSLTSTLTDQLANLLDSRLGPVDGELPSDSGQHDSNLVDLYIFDRIRYSLNNPSSNWYIKTLFENYKNPPLNPFKPKKINIGSFDIFQGFKLSNVTLSNIVVTGFPNATVPAETMILAPPKVTLDVSLGSLGSGTTATADFSASYTGGTLEFGITVTIKSLLLNANIVPGGKDASELVVRFNSLNCKVINTEDMKISISDHTGFGPAIEKVLNTQQVQNKIMSAINNQLHDNLTPISNEVTNLIKKLIHNQLG